jgi:Sulfotransferase domain
MAHSPLNFFIVGAPKCGTTSVFYYLSQHPNVYNLWLKEPHFLCSDFPRLRAVADEAHYNQLFSRVTAQHLAVGEASMTYMYSDVALLRIREINPAARLIMLVRNPADMVHSWHSHSLATLNEDEPDFEKAWTLQHERSHGRRLPPQCLEPFFLQYRQVGMLGSYLQKIYTLFPSESIKVVFHDDIKADIRATYDDLLAFLKLPPFAEVSFRPMNDNKMIRNRFIARLTERNAGVRYTRRLQWVKKALGLGQLSVRSRLRKFNQVKVQRKPMRPEFRRTLLREFEQDIQLLAELTHRNLDHWLH